MKGKLATESTDVAASGRRFRGEAATIEPRKTRKTRKRGATRGRRAPPAFSWLSCFSWFESLTAPLRGISGPATSVFSVAVLGAGR